VCKTEPAPPTPPSSSTDPSHYADPCQACIGTILRIQLVDARDHSTGLESATLGASGKPSLTSDATGWVRYDPIPAGSYDVFGEGEACSPARVERAGVAVPAGQTTQVVLETTPCEIRLHLDADRDGVIDAGWTDRESWRAGSGRLGAVVLVNSDRDGGGTSGQDFDNTRVDTGADLPDIAPLALRKTIPGVAFPGNYTVTLAVAAPDKLRVFGDRTGSATALIGPSPAPAQHAWGAAALGDEKMLGMEALGYPAVAGGRDTIDLTLSMKRGTRVLYTQSVTVRIAPWICYNHKHKTVRVHVLATADNATFRGLLRPAVTAVGVTLVETPGHGGDRWMQDVMEPGFASMPRVGGPTSKWHTPVTMRSVQDRDAQHYVRNVMLGADHGLVQGGPTVPAETWDSFGNLECSPPFTHRRTGRRYAFGRMIHGGAGTSRMDASNRRFLANQRVQEPFEIDTSWLRVGHVDEVVSFLPHGGSTHGYKVVLANPTRALALVRAAPAGARMMTGYLPTSGTPGPGQSLAKLSVKYPFHTAGAFRSDAAMVAHQATAQGHINGIRATLRRELDLEASDFITFPVLFEEHRRTGELIAHTPGAVNMLVLTETPTRVRLCVPKPFGPIVGGTCSFEREILTTLARIGIPAARVRFIDDFATYHCLAGEVHCGTNSEREAPDGTWWWDMDWV
jgi:hypothetical protein